MNIGFIGTFFPEVELILDKLVGDDYDLNFLTDSSTNKNLIKNKKIKFNSINDYKNGEINQYCDFGTLDLLFNVDKDRFEEFGINNPKYYELLCNYNVIINAFKIWFDENDISFVILEGPNNFFNRVIISYMDKNNIHYYSFKCGRLPNSTFVSYRSNEILRSKNYKKDSNISGSKKVDYMSTKHKNHRGLYSKIVNFKSTDLYNDVNVLYKNRLNLSEEYSYVYNIPRIKLILKTRFLFIKKYVFKFLINAMNKTEIDTSKELYLYPEHYRPEAATSAYDFDLRDDILNILNIKTILKNNQVIVFRFHPSYFTKRSLKQLFFLKKLERDGEIFISYPDESLTDVINASNGVITVSSSVAIDALRNGKSSIILGNPEYLNLFNGNGLYSQSIHEIDLSVLFNSDVKSEKVDDELSKIYLPYSYRSGKWLEYVIKHYETFT